MAASLVYTSRMACQISSGVWHPLTPAASLAATSLWDGPGRLSVRFHVRTDVYTEIASSFLERRSLPWHQPLSAVRAAARPTIGARRTAPHAGNHWGLARRARALRRRCPTPKCPLPMHRATSQVDSSRGYRGARPSGWRWESLAGSSSQSGSRRHIARFKRAAIPTSLLMPASMPASPLGLRMGLAWLRSALMRRKSGKH